MKKSKSTIYFFSVCFLLIIVCASCENTPNNDGNNGWKPVGIAVEDTLLNQVSIQRLALDSNGSIWAGEYGGWLYWINLEGEVTKFTNNDGLLGTTQFWSIAPADNNDVWIGAWDKGISHLTHGGTMDKGDDMWVNFTEQDTCISSNKVIDLVKDAGGDIWIAHTKSYGIDYLDLSGNNECINYSSDNSRMELGTHQTGQGLLQRITFGFSGVKWISQSEYGFYKWQDKGTPLEPGDDEWKSFTPSSSGLISALVKNVMEMSDGVLWVPTNSGITLFYNEIKVKDISTENGLPDPLINDIIQDWEQRIWIATQSGVAVFGGGKNPALLGVFDKGAGLISDKTTALCVDNTREVIWIGTDEGLNKVKVFKK